MGKASKWFRGLLGLKRPDSPSPTVVPKDKRRWSLVKSYRQKDPMPAAHAAASAAVAPLASNGREEWAAIKIQAAFRGSLIYKSKGAPPPCKIRFFWMTFSAHPSWARKALGALKGLVKLQALVRGHIERKRTAEWLQRVQALLRVQAQIRADRAQILHSPYSNAHLHGPATPHKFESPVKSESMKYDQYSSSLLKRNSSKSRAQINGGNQEKCGSRSSDSRIDEQPWTQRRSWTRASSMDEERSMRILEIDHVKPHITSKRRNLFYYPSQAMVVSDQYYSQCLTTTSPSSYEVHEETSFCAADNSPQALYASSKDGASKSSPLTPTRSDGSRSHLSGYSEPDYPSYMAYTESSKAKLRSLSAPKQRPQYERCSSSNNRYSQQLHSHGFGDSSKLATQRIAALHASFTNKAYPGSGRLDKLGLHVPYKY